MKPFRQHTRVLDTHMHSLPPRTVSERTRKSWPSEIFTTSAALGSSAMHTDEKHHEDPPISEFVVSDFARALLAALGVSTPSSSGEPDVDDEDTAGNWSNKPWPNLG